MDPFPVPEGRMYRKIAASPAIGRWAWSIRGPTWATQTAHPPWLSSTKQSYSCRQAGRATRAHSMMYCKQCNRREDMVSHGRDLINATSPNHTHTHAKHTHKRTQTHAQAQTHKHTHTHKRTHKHTYVHTHYCGVQPEGLGGSSPEQLRLDQRRAQHVHLQRSSR